LLVTSGVIAIILGAIVMSAEDMLDAALAGLDHGGVVTIPSLPDTAEGTSLRLRALS